MRLLRIAEHRAVAGFTHGEQHVRLALDLDGFIPGLEVFPRHGTVWRRHAVLARVGRIDLLQVQVLYIWRGIGKCPGCLAGTTQYDERKSRQGCAHGVYGCRHAAVSGFACRGRQARKVPDGGRRKTQVRVIGQQGFATGSARARDHPAVRTLAVHDAQAARPVVDATRHGDQCAVV